MYSASCLLLALGPGSLSVMVKMLKMLAVQEAPHLHGGDLDGVQRPTQHLPVSFSSEETP